MSNTALKDFFKIIELKKEDDKTYTSLTRFNSGHDIYKGHFPGNPVVPGVCIIQILKELVGKIIGKEVLLIQAVNIKFLHVLNPDKHSDINWEINVNSKENSEIEIRSTAFAGEKVCFKFSGVFR